MLSKEQTLQNTILRKELHTRRLEDIFCGKTYILPFTQNASRKFSLKQKEVDEASKKNNCESRKVNQSDERRRIPIQPDPA